MRNTGNLAFEALADPTRRTILLLLAGQGETTAGDIVAHCDNASRTGVSAHLRVLRTAGLVSERKQGRFRLYSLEPGAANEVVGFLTELYAGSLSELKQRAEAAAEAEPKRRPKGQRSA